MFFDSHCHLDDAALASDLPRLLARARSAGVTGFLIPGVHPDAWPAISQLARDYPEILPAFGVHPMHAELVTPDLLAQLQCRTRETRAIGEIGLDYLLDSPSRQIQIEAFRAQLRLAVQAGLPVLIHCRKAFADLLSIFQQEGGAKVGGVMHGFSGSPETARDCINLNLHISIGGTVTYRNAVRPPAVARSVPLERLLLETDAPDLAPEPHRGSVNLPHYLLETANCVARLRGITPEELGRATTENATVLFRRRLPEG